MPLSDSPVTRRTYAGRRNDVHRSGSRARRDGPFIESIGTYDPLAAGTNYSVDVDKADSWIKKGAKPSETVMSLIRKTRKAAAK